MKFISIAEHGGWLHALTECGRCFIYYGHVRGWEQVPGPKDAKK